MCVRCLVSFRLCGSVVTEGPLRSHAEFSARPHPSIPPGLAAAYYVGKYSLTSARPGYAFPKRREYMRIRPSSPMTCIWYCLITRTVVCNLSLFLIVCCCLPLDWTNDRPVSVSPEIALSVCIIMMLSIHCASTSISWNRMIC